MDIIAKLPGMPDESLKSLRANAQRLERVGSAGQRGSAAALLPAIDLELAARREAKLASAPPRAPRASTRRRTTAAAKAETSETPIKAIAS